MECLIELIEAFGFAPTLLERWVANFGNVTAASGLLR